MLKCKVWPLIQKDFHCKYSHSYLIVNTFIKNYPVSPSAHRITN